MTLDTYFQIVEQELDTNSKALRAAFEEIFRREDSMVRYGGNTKWLVDDLMAAVRHELLEGPREIVAEAGGLSE